MNNLSVFKRLGRVSKVHNSKIDKNGINIIVGLEAVTLYFDKDINLAEQKIKISNKVKDLNNKVNVLMEKLENKSFVRPQWNILNEDGKTWKFFNPEKNCYNRKNNFCSFNKSSAASVIP